MIWKLFLILLSVSLSSCRGSIPRWDGKIYSADSDRESIRRAQEDEEILCRDASFDNYICMSHSDFKSFVDTYIGKCAKWKPNTQMMSPPDDLESLYNDAGALQ